MKKVFFIGFNKTATTSLHHLFLNSGYTSIHHKHKKNYLAVTIERNYLNKRPILDSIDFTDCYIDLVYSDNFHYIEANKYFKEFYKEYPDSFFIFQKRDVDSWVRSRSLHKGNETFLKRVGNALSLSDKEVQEYWRQLYFEHYRNVALFFKNKENFLEFDIDDDIEILINFLSPEIEINKNEWEFHNVTRI